MPVFAAATDPGQEHWAATRLAELFTADMLASNV